MESKSLLFVLPNSYPCVTGGIEVFNNHLLKNICDSFRITVISHCPSNEIKGVNYIHIPTPRLRKLFSPLLILHKILRLKEKPKLIYLSYSRSYWSHWIIYPILSIFFNIPYSFTIHGGGLSAWKPRWPHKLFFKHAEDITGVSKEIILEYEMRSKRKISFTPPLLPFKVINNKKQLDAKLSKWSKKKILLFVGSIKKLKRVDTIIDAIALFEPIEIEKNNLLVLIVGGGELLEEYKNRVRELQLEDVIEFTGRVPYERISEYYSIADIFAICSEFEGLPIVLLEAFANKLPCIVSDADSLVSIAKENSLLFEVGNEYEFKNNLEILLKNKELRQSLGEKGFSYYREHFSYDKLLSDFNAIFSGESKKK